MGENKFEVFCDVTGTGKFINCIASNMSLKDAMLFIKACIEEYWCDFDSAYIIKHMPRVEVKENE